MLRRIYEQIPKGVTYHLSWCFFISFPLLYPEYRLSQMQSHSNSRKIFLLFPLLLFALSQNLGYNISYNLDNKERYLSLQKITQVIFLWSCWLHR